MAKSRKHIAMGKHSVCGRSFETKVNVPLGWTFDSITCQTCRAQFRHKPKDAVQVILALLKRGEPEATLFAAELKRLRLFSGLTIVEWLLEERGKITDILHKIGE